MIIKNRIWICQLLILGMLLLITNSCKKDDTIIKKDGPIIKKDVIITWTNPAAILPGTPLSAT
jgi:hypothetical protein